MNVVTKCKKDSQTVPGRLFNRDCLWFTISKTIVILQIQKMKFYVLNKCWTI